MAKSHNLSVFLTVLALYGSTVSGQDEQFCWSQDCCTGLPEKTSLGDWNNCTIFYICTSSNAVPFACPQGTPNYNPEIRICDRNVSGCDGGTRAPEGSTSTPVTSDPTTGSPINGNCTGDGAYFIPYPGETDCRQYMICSDGILFPEVQECPPGTLFDPELRECNLESLVQCKPICPGNETISLPHASNCNMYWLCILGVATSKTCLPGLVFDPEIGTCNIEDAVFCPNMCPNVGTVNLPHAKNCSSYWLCTLGHPTLKTCPTGLLFDPSVGQCNIADSVQCDTTTGASYLLKFDNFSEEESDEINDDYADYELVEEAAVSSTETETF